MVVPEVSYKWKDLGIQLLKSGRKMGILNEIEANYSQDVRRCCQVMLEKWLELQSDASWGQLIEALESQAVEMVNLADRIRSTVGMVSLCCNINKGSASVLKLGHKLLT